MATRGGNGDATINMMKLTYRKAWNMATAEIMGLESSEVTINMTIFLQEGPTSDVYWGSRLMYYCMASAAKVVSDAVHGNVEKYVEISDESKLLFINQGAIEEPLCGI